MGKIQDYLENKNKNGTKIIPIRHHDFPRYLHFFCASFVEFFKTAFKFLLNWWWLLSLVCSSNINTLTSWAFCLKPCGPRTWHILRLKILVKGLSKNVLCTPRIVTKSILTTWRSIVRSCSSRTRSRPLQTFFSMFIIYCSLLRIT